MDQPKLERLLRLMKLLTANTTYNVDQLPNGSRCRAAPSTAT